MLGKLKTAIAMACSVILGSALIPVEAAEYEIIAAQVKQELQRAAEVLQVEGYCRIDAFVRVFDSGKAETIIIEVNSLPGLTPATCIFHQAALNQYKPLDFIDRIVQYGFERASVRVIG